MAKTNDTFANGVVAKTMRQGLLNVTDLLKVENDIIIASGDEANDGKEELSRKKVVSKNIITAINEVQGNSNKINTNKIATGTQAPVITEKVGINISGNANTTDNIKIVDMRTNPTTLLTGYKLIQIVDELPSDASSHIDVLYITLE